MNIAASEVQTGFPEIQFTCRLIRDEPIRMEMDE